MSTQLDNNRIAIRERTILEIMDLALLVVRSELVPLTMLLLIGAVPFALLNAWLLAPMAEPSYLEDAAVPVRYTFSMLLLVGWQLPLATAPLTLYLGQMMFRDQPAGAQVARDFAGSLPQLFWYQVLFVRGLVFGLAVWNIWSNDVGWQVPFALPIAFALSYRPFLGEVILLERNPWRSGKGGRISTWDRARRLHQGGFGELFPRFLTVVGLGVVLTASLWLSLWTVLSQLLGAWQSAKVGFLILMPIALWLIVGYLAVVRFLSYLDLRIRREGWEVELVMRAEAAKLAEA